MVFHWSLSENKSLQVSRILLSILAVLNNVAVWMVSTRPLISKSSNLFINLLVAVLKAPITIGIIVIFMFHGFFQFSSKVAVLILLLIFFQFYSVVIWDSKIRNFASYLFLLIITRSGLLKIPVEFVCVIPQDWCWVVYIPFVRMVKFDFLYNSQWITLPTQSCLVLFSFRAKLLHSFFMWLIVSSLSSHNLHLLFCCVLSALALI